MAVIEHINETRDFITYRISEEYVLTRNKVHEFLEVRYNGKRSIVSLQEDVRKVHEANEKVTKEAVAASTRERA